MESRYSRRFFIGGALSFGACAGCRAFTKAGAASEGGELLKLGVLSDIHVSGNGQVPCLVRALEFFRDRKVDGVLIAGDMADRGTLGELRLVAEAWYQVFPGGRLPDGRKVEQLFLYGNHDMWGRGKDAIKIDPRAAWEEFFHEAWAPIMKTEVKGVPVVRAHWQEGEPGNQVEQWMKEHGGAFDPSLPFIYSQHDHPADTCLGPWAWGHDDGRATRALSPFPNTVAFSGHSHYTLTDERSYWQGAFTSINTSSLRYAGMAYSLRENAGINQFGFRAGPRRRMNSIYTRDGNQGQVVTFWRDHLAVERREFCYGESLGDDLVIPLPTAESAPFSDAARAARRSAPEFAEGAEVRVAHVGPKKERDFDRIEIRFPAACEVNRCRVSEYEVTAVLCEEDIELVQSQRRMMSPDFYLPRSKSVDEVLFTFAAEDLPVKGHYRFEVRALECFGKKGGKIVSPLTLVEGA